MSRPPNLSRKGQLLADILDYFSDRSLASLSFRTLARGLGVSTYSLVYHFGSREQLLSEIVRAISERQKEAYEHVSGAELTVDGFFAWLTASFAWQLEEANVQLQRLEFEGAMIEALEPGLHTYTREVFSYWLVETEAMLVSLGLTSQDAAIESRILNNLFYGFQYDLVLNQNVAAAEAAFALALERFRAHVGALIGHSG